MIQDAIRQAQRLHREVVEATYDGICDAYERQQYKNLGTKVTSSKEIPVYEKQPCHLSFASSPAAVAGDKTAKAVQTIKLFLAPELEIKPGSKLVVTQAGRTECYSQSGKPAVYSSHQEILLELWKGYA